VTIDTVMRVVPFGTPSSGSFDVRGTRKYSVCFQSFLLKILFEKKNLQTVCDEFPDFTEERPASRQFIVQAYYVSL
jgi:hypothetical protein